MRMGKRVWQDSFEATQKNTAEYNLVLFFRLGFAFFSEGKGKREKPP